MAEAIEQLHRFFGEDIPFTTYLYNIKTGSIGLGEATTLILKENVCNLEEDELFVFDKMHRKSINMKSSKLQVILKKDTVLALRYDDLVLFCIAEAADLFKALLKRAELEQYRMPEELPVRAYGASKKAKKSILMKH